MNKIIHDIMDDPGEFLPILLIVAALVLFWSALCLSGVVSIRAATRRRKLCFALAPLVFGFIGLWAQLPFSMESDGFRLSIDFRWFFIVPLLLGILGLASWRRLREKAEV